MKSKIAVSVLRFSIAVLPLLLTACILLSDFNNSTQGSSDDNKSSSDTDTIDDTCFHRNL